MDTSVAAPFAAGCAHGKLTTTTAADATAGTSASRRPVAHAIRAALESLDRAALGVMRNGSPVSAAIVLPYRGTRNSMAPAPVDCVLVQPGAVRARRWSQITEVPMRSLVATFLAAIAMLLSPAAAAFFHTFQIDQVYSNASGTVQFVTMTTSLDGENLSQGVVFTSNDAAGNMKKFTFPSNLPSFSTAGKHILIATQSFAALGLVTPDFVIPDNFVPTGAGSVSDAFTSLSWDAGQLPNDGVNALYRTGVKQNLATNFAGNSASVQPAAAITPQVGNWSNPAEQGTGYAMDFKHGVLVVVFFSFQVNGEAEWYIASGPLNGNTFTGTLDKFKNGQCISASCPFKFPTSDGNDGGVTIVFSSNTSATMTLPGGRVIPISPTAF
jgi:hypothetical protein